MKIGLFGGTFDPIHQAHIAVALRFAELLSLDRVIVMPTGAPPHKIKASSAASHHRLAMCRLAAEPYPVLAVSDMEIRRGGASFTADTLAALDAEMPGNEWFLLTGADMFMTLGSWNRFDEIAARATLCSTPRPPITMKEMQAYQQELQRRGARVFLAPAVSSKLSSTDIRRDIREDKSLAEDLPPAVARYIEENQLYKDEKQMEKKTTDEQFIEIIKGRLSEKRFHHSLCVAKEAERLAEKYGADPAKAKTAGILHDILKDTAAQTQLQILDDFGILMSNIERSAKKLYHAMAGAAFIEHILKLDDPEILDAIRYHTTAKAGMSRLATVLYLADFTSADRDYDDVDEMRRLVDIGIPEAMRYALGYTIRDLVEKQVPVHPDTLAAYNEYMLNKPQN